MEPDIRPITEAELVSWLRMLETAAGRYLSDEVVEDAAALESLERTQAAFVDGEMVGGNASEELELTVPGPRTLRAARITLAAVLPAHRRSGIVTALFTRQVADLRARGDPLAIFTTTGPGLYRRVGYSPAAVAVEVEIDTAHAALDAPLDTPGTVRLVPPDDAAGLLPDVFDRHRAAQPGQVARTPAFWRMWLLDRPQFRRGEPGDRFFAAYTDAGGRPQGYVAYRLRGGPPRDQPIATLVVEELVAATGDARRALWAYCLAFGQAERVTAPNIAADEPVGWMLADPRRLRVTRVRDFLWLRLLDVPGALAARRYSETGTVVLEVADPTCAENHGCFRLEADGDARCERSGDPADVALGVDDLAAAYLGGCSFTTLARAGRVRELTPGAVTRCDRLFASHPLPWTVTDW